MCIDAPNELSRVRECDLRLRCAIRHASDYVQTETYHHRQVDPSHPLLRALHALLAAGLAAPAPAGAPDIESADPTDALGKGWA